MISMDSFQSHCQVTSSILSTRSTKRWNWSDLVLTSKLRNILTLTFPPFKARACDYDAQKNFHGPTQVFFVRLRKFSQFNEHISFCQNCRDFRHEIEWIKIQVLENSLLSAHWSGCNRAQVGLYIDFKILAGNSFAWLVWSGRPKATVLLDTWSLEVLKWGNILGLLIRYNIHHVIREPWQSCFEPQKATGREGFAAL